MEPARKVPENNPQGNSLDALEGILREATRNLPAAAPKPRSAQAPKPAAAPSAADIASVKFEIDQRRRFVGPTQREKQGFEFTPLRITAIVLGVVASLLWGRLLVVGASPQVPPVDPQYAVASMRWMLVLTSERVEDFRRANHRTPHALSEIGNLPTSLIVYERLSDDRYRLTGPSSAGPLVLDSMGSTGDFLGHSLETLGGSPRVAR